MRAARREAEHGVAFRLADVGDRIRGHVRVADPAARERADSTAAVRSARGSLEQRRCPTSRAETTASSGAHPRPTRPRGRARPRRRPSAPRASSSAGRRRRRGGHVSRRSTLKRAVSWLSRIVHEWRTHDQGMPARNAPHRRDDRLAGKPWHADRQAEEARSRDRSGAPSPRSHAHTGRVKPA